MGWDIAHLGAATVLSMRHLCLTALLPQGEERFEYVVPFGLKLLTKFPKFICARVDVF